MRQSILESTAASPSNISSIIYAGFSLSQTLHKNYPYLDLTFHLQKV